MEYQSLKLEVISANKMVIQRDVVNIIIHTSEGNIGILPGHEPLVVALVPYIVEIVVAGDRVKILTVDGGLLAATQGHTRTLSHRVKLAGEIFLWEAHPEAHELHRLRSGGEATGEQVHHLHTLNAQIQTGGEYQTNH